MKFLFTLLFLGIVSYAIAQTGTLHAGVYSWSNTKVQKNGVIEKRIILKGETLDLKNFEIYTSTLDPASAYIPPGSESRFERLIIVKSGTLKLTLNDTTKTVGPGSLALVLADDKNIAFSNPSSKPVTWYVLNYESKNPANIKRGNGAGHSYIQDWNSLHVNVTSKGETRAVFVRPTSMFEKLDVHATALNPGFASHDPHTHRVEELILMLKGSVQEVIAQDKFDAQEGDCIFLSSGILHGPKNISNSQCYYYAIQWHNLKTD
jgi:(S)-ureidoglycine aminohydrolase